MTQTGAFTVIVTLFVVAVAVASGQSQAEPGRRLRSAIVLLVTLAIVAALCLFLATRHGH